jgi:hypothetical protein
MIGIVILNMVFCAGVVIGIVALLGWAILTDRPAAAALTHRAHHRARVARTARTSQRLRRIAAEA